ncbi:branched-chain amino acid transport system permease protein [Spirochaetota bacterium]|nr:branched-chain amino acid transport system permease protein [Spirochaetota bacterium]
MQDLLIFFSNPPLIVQAILNGLVIGGLFSLVAYGLALVWGVMNIINVAQGEFVILGAYVTFYFAKTGYSPLWSIPLSMAVLYLIGWLVYRTIIFRIIDRDLFTSLLATFGISILLQQLMNLAFGADVQIVDAHLPTLFIMDHAVAIPVIRLISFILAFVIAAVMVLFLKRSRLGQAIRATAQNERAAKILGVNTQRVYASTFAINAAICGGAGALVAMTFSIHPYIGLPYTVRSFMIVIFAGIGNFSGVILSAFALGSLEEIADFVLGAEFRLAFIFSLLVIVLVWRNWRLGKKREYLK